MMQITLCKLFGISKIVEVYAFVVNVQQQNVRVECEFEQVFLYYSNRKVSIEGQSSFSFRSRLAVTVFCFRYRCEVAR